MENESLIKPACITVFIQNTDGQYLLIRRASSQHYGIWQPVTGKIEKNETAIDAAYREMIEETAIVPDKLYFANHVETFYHEQLDRIMHSPVFYASVGKKEVILSPLEHDAFQWVSYEKAYELMPFISQKETLTLIHAHGVKERFRIALRQNRAPFIETDRLLFYHPCKEDIAEIYRLMSCKDVMRHCFPLDDPITIEQAERILEKAISNNNKYKLSRSIVVLKQSNQLIGYCGLYWFELDGKKFAELGCILAKKYWKQGIATEACSAIKNYTKEKLGTTNLCSMLKEENIASKNLCKRLGGVFYKKHVYENTPVDLYRY